ncbi:MAG: FAD-dependent oxidoreductase [Cyanobacteriota bacterium]|nr:FAD-dependent oxidoreductase [Cyanobacteriota bacterium]
MTVAVIGAGLAGSLLALELADLAVPVRLFDPDPAGASATALSYGAVAGWAAPPTDLGRLMRQAPRRWRVLQHRHGDLGWRRRWLQLPSLPLPLPCGQVEAPRLLDRLTPLLQRRGVAVIQQRVTRLERRGEDWWLQLAAGNNELAPAVVLASGAASGDLWPGLSDRLWVSWAGVLELAAWPGGRRGRLLLPARFERLALEHRAAELDHETWVVDRGLVPWAERALAGQISLVRPTPLAGTPPDPALMEQHLRQELEQLDPTLAAAPGRYRQAPVAFCREGPPLAGPVPGAPGLWQFTGFSAGFSQAPVLAPLLAQALTLRGAQAEAAEQRLRRLGVWG